MKRSKTLLSVVLAVMTIGLAACSQDNTTPTSTPSTPGSSDVQHTYELTYTGEAKAGSTLTFILKQDGSMISQSSVTYTISDETKGTVSGNKITFTEGGTYTVSGSLGGNVVATTSITIAEGEKIYTIAEVIAEADKGNTGTSNLYTVQGKITASAGTSAYIADATGGMYIYNWSTNNGDTAITSKKFTAGTSVQLTCYVASYNNAYQFSNYSSGRLEGTSALLLDKEVASMAPIELDETSFKALTIKDQGKVYTFEAEYVSDAPTTTGSNVNTKFKLGDTEVILFYSKYDKTLPANASSLKAGSKYKITAPMTWYASGNTAEFAYCSDGTTIEEIVKPLDVSYTGKTRVGKTLTLTTTASGTTVTEGVTYSVTAGSEYVTLNDNGTVTLNAAGDVTIQASYTGSDGTALTATTSFTIGAALSYTALAEVANITTKGTEFKTEAYLLGMSPAYKGAYTYVYIGSGTSGLYLYSVATSLLDGISVGDLISIEAKYDPSYVEGYDVDYVEKLSDNTNSVTQATDLSYTAENATALTKADSGRKVTLTKAKVTAVSLDSYGNVTATLSLNDVEYSMYLDSRYNDVTTAKTILVGYNVTLTGFTGYNSKGDVTRIQTLSSIKIEESFILSQTTGQIELEGGNKTLKLSASYVGGTSDATVTWASSDTEVATVAEDGTVTGVAVGTTTITATKGELTATCEITVVQKADPVVTISSNGFADSAYQTTGSGTGYTQTVSGITLTCASGDGSLWSATSGKTIRVYKNKKLTISSTVGKMYKIEFTYSAYNLTATTGFDSDNKIWTSTTGETSVEFTGSGGTVQITQIKVTYKEDTTTAA